MSPDFETSLWNAFDKVRGHMTLDSFQHTILATLALRYGVNLSNEGQVNALPSFEDLRASPSPAKAFQHMCKELSRDHPELGDALIGPAMQIDRLENRAARSIIEFVASLPTPMKKQHLADLASQCVRARSERDGRRGGNHTTPADVAHLALRFLRPAPGARVLDPCCGHAEFLVTAARQVPGVELHGVEINPEVAALARLRLALSGTPTIIDEANFLTTPPLDADKRLAKFDIIVASPPWGLKSWDRASVEADPYDRFPWGIPPNTSSELAFVEAIASSLTDKGRALVLLPNGIMFREGPVGQIRAGLLQDDLIEAVIELGPGILYGTNLPATALILNHAKSADRRGKLLVVDASDDVTKGRGRNTLSPGHMDQIVSLYQGVSPDGRCSAFVAIDDILEQDAILTPSRWLTVDAQPGPDLETAQAAYFKANQALEAATSAFDAALQEAQNVQ